LLFIVNVFEFDFA